MLLLHLISEVCRDIHLISIDTRFVFPITCSFKNNVTKLLDFDVNEIESSTPLQLQKDEDIFFTI